MLRLNLQIAGAVEGEKGPQNTGIGAGFVPKILNTEILMKLLQYPMMMPLLHPKILQRQREY